MARISRRLTAINAAASIEEIDLPGFRLHQLKGNRSGIWAVSVTGNWHITFAPQTEEDDDGDGAFDVWDVELEDYH